jgi:hypothetical protein
MERDRKTRPELPSGSREARRPEEPEDGKGRGKRGYEIAFLNDQ